MTNRSSEVINNFSRSRRRTGLRVRLSAFTADRCMTPSLPWLQRHKYVTQTVTF